MTDQISKPKCTPPQSIWASGVPGQSYGNWYPEQGGGVDTEYLLATPQRKAAPELYEALWEVLDGLGALSNPSELYGYGYDDDWPDKILGVLAKARGESND